MTEVSYLIPDGSVSIEVYADAKTKAGEMLKQAKDFFTWIPNAHIKFPITKEGLKAAEKAIKAGIRINMTLCFNQGQAAAVYTATKGAKKGDVFISPFVGRLDDLGENGMRLVANVIKMYQQGDGHVEVLTSSVRTLDHLLYALQLGSDIITSPFNILKEWAEKGLIVPDKSYEYKFGDLKPMPYQNLDLNQAWQSYDIRHGLTDKGIQRFSEDWNNLIK